MKLYIQSASNVGCVRENNEDMILVNHQYVRDGVYADEVNLAKVHRSLTALADGMGGHNSGEVASNTVLQNLDYFYDDMPEGLGVADFNEAIFEWLGSINNVIESKGHVEPQYHNMGTTLVAFAYYAGEFFWMNCGDSRVYILSNGRLQQLSTDHSLNTLIGSSEHSNLITNCIGGGCKTSYIDVVTCTDQVMIGDVFMLCSDGLTDMVADADIEALLNAGAGANALCEAAIGAGGHDNVSVCLIKIVK